MSWLRLSRRQAGSVPFSEVCSAPKGSRMLSSLSLPRAMSHTVAWVDARNDPVLPSRLPAKACKPYAHITYCHHWANPTRLRLYWRVISSD